jgi:peptide/nickel transport system substrate-binding protein/oligopeptide transport system substrate-binding protein
MENGKFKRRILSMRKKLTLCAVLLLVFTLLLTACTQANQSKKNLVIQLAGNTETLDPGLNTTVDAANYMIFGFEGLLIKDENGKIQPGQAASWEVSNDGMTYTFKLRDGLKWSDGSKLTAEDFVFSWQRVCDPITAAPYASTVLSMVKGFDEAEATGNAAALAVTAPDAKTFIVELTWNCPYFEGLCAFPALYPVQRATVEANGDAWSTSAKTYVSNGPFMVTDIVQSSHVTFTKNPNYRDTNRVKLNSIKCLFIENDAATLAAYRSGEANMIKSLPAGEMDTLKNDPDFKLSPLQGTYYLDLNNQREPFTDARVRKALSLAIDRKYVANTLMKGTYFPAPNFVGPGISDWDSSDFMSNANGRKTYIDLEDHEGNVTQAKELLVEAGYPGGAGIPEFVYSFNDSAYHKVVAEYLQQAWAGLGISVKLDIVEWASFAPLRRAGDYDACRDGWLLDYDDPSNLLELAETGNGNNNSQHSNPEFDAAMVRSRTAATREERWAALHEAEDILMDDMGVTPVAYYADFYLINPNVTGWWHSPDGFWNFQFADIT